MTFIKYHNYSNCFTPDDSIRGHLGPKSVLKRHGKIESDNAVDILSFDKIFPGTDIAQYDFQK